VGPVVCRKVRSLALPSKRRAGLLVAGLFAMSWSREGAAAGKKGDFLQTDTLGVSLVSRDMTAHTTRTVADAVNLSEFVGLHYYAVQRVRFGMNLQLTERLWPAPPSPQSRVQRFAFLPQVGWNFYDPFFAGLVFAFAPRSEGVPWTYYPHQMIGLTALTGVSFRF
jgi:hypothetical protein